MSFWAGDKIDLETVEKKKEKKKLTLQSLLVSVPEMRKTIHQRRASAVK